MWTTCLKVREQNDRLRMLEHNRDIRRQAHNKRIKEITDVSIIETTIFIGKSI